MAFEFEDKDVKLISQFTGLRNNVTSESMDPNDLSEAVNIDITDALRLRRRNGYAEIVSGAYHSLWSNGSVCFVMAGGTLNRINDDNSITPIRAGLSPAVPMSYGELAGRVYFSNQVETGVYTGGIVREWGIRPPVTQPSAFQIGGDLRAGTYQYAMTFQRDDGAESGTGLAGTITLDSAAGIAFRSIPTSSDPHVTKRNIYITPFDGDMMYMLIQLGIGETAATYTVERTGSIPLTTQYLSPAPPGQLVTTYNGRMYVASANRLYPSLPFAPELFDIRANFTFGSEITLLAAMQDGLFIGTETELLWLDGDGPEEFKHVEKAAYGAIPGTASFTTAHNITADAQGLAVFFATSSGTICYGLNGGIMHDITHDKFEFPVTARGAGLVRKHDGMIQYLTALQGTGIIGNTAF